MQTREQLAEFHKSQALEHASAGRFDQAEKKYIDAATLFFEGGGDDLATCAALYIQAAKVRIDNEPNKKDERWRVAGYFTTAIEKLKVYNGLNKHQLIAEAYQLREREYRESFQGETARAEADSKSVTEHFAQWAQCSAQFSLGNRNSTVSTTRCDTSTNSENEYFVQFNTESNQDFSCLVREVKTETNLPLQWAKEDAKVAKEKQAQKKKDDEAAKALKKQNIFAMREARKQAYQATLEARKKIQESRKMKK